MKKAILRIDGMHCDGCAAIVQSLLARQAGVQSVRASYAEGLAQVLFEPQAISEQALVSVIENAGYQVTSRFTTAEVP
ncbi:heavy-metal-associated domain-containing protein [Cupriavidus sp. CP313]